VKEAGCKWIHAQTLNQDPVENTFGAMRSYCGFNGNSTVGHSADALKTSIINGLAFRGLCGTNCEDDGATVLDNVQLLLRGPDAEDSGDFIFQQNGAPHHWHWDV
jgi:hypothetical protein